MSGQLALLPRDLAAPVTIHSGLHQFLAKGPQRGQHQFEDEHLFDWVDKVARGLDARPAADVP